MTPHDMLAGRQQEFHAARDRKLEQARQQRQLRRQPSRESGPLGDKSIEEMKQRYEAERDKAFRSHVCVAHARERGV